MKRGLFAMVVAGMLLLSLSPSSAPVRAQAEPPLTPQAALERLFTAPQIERGWFAPAFLAQISEAQVATIISQLRDSLGAYQGVVVEGNGFAVNFERGIVPATISLDNQGRIDGLFFRPPRARDAAAGLADAVQTIHGLPGTVSLLVLRDGQEQVAVNPEQPLAVGSAFKLAILQALRRQVERGDRSWADVVSLDPAQKSLPSGLLQDWPDGAPLTLHTLASLMISRSDNTATDVLLHLVGRENVEALVPERNHPYFSTRELFILKTPANADLLARFRAGSEAEQRAVVAETATRPLPKVEDYPTTVTALDVEWLFTTRELCALMATVQDLPLMAINPGVALRSDWAHVAYKGGSEPGVLNMTTWLQRADGARFCVAVTWNNSEPVSTEALTLPLGTLLAALKEQP